MQTRITSLLGAILTTSLLLSFDPVQSAPTPTSKNPRPNILWISCEDTSFNFGCFGDPYARTPNIDALAREGVRYTHAFASAPVCSPVRSSIITGMYATSLGTQRLRSTFPVPSFVRPFTTGLRDAGYYCSNNSKTDYNLQNEPAFIRAAWDESSPKAHWRNRKPGQPFFAVFNLMVSHQSRASVWPYEQFEKEVASQLTPAERHDPAKAPIPPFYPDTAKVRRTLARYEDCVTVMDKQAGELLRQLKEDGLAENTIVFFYPDQGMGLPRGKRVLHDTGLQVALIIRFPEKFKTLAPAPVGGTTDRLVSTVDFGPTVLSLAGLPVPTYMQGVPFLGSETGRPREFVVGARDRVDEVFDLSRSVRDGRWLYIRNFMPHLSWMQPEAFSDRSDMRRELKRLAAEDKLNADQLTYAAPRRALEELYDSKQDPVQLHNLAGSPEHRDVLEQMRQRLHDWMLATRDAGFLTESQMWRRIGKNQTPLEWARDENRYPLSRLLAVADTVGRPEAVARQTRWLRDRDDGVRYWAAVGLNAAGKRAAPAREALVKALGDTEPVVRIEAATALARLGETTRALAVLEKELGNKDTWVVLHAARALELLGSVARPALPAMRATLATAESREGDPWMFVAFSLKAAVEGLQAGGTRTIR